MNEIYYDKKLKKAFERLDTALGIPTLQDANIPYKNTQTAILIYGVSAIILFQLINIEIALGVFILGLTNHFYMKHELNKVHKYNINAVCEPSTFCNAYENVYYTNLDENRLQKAKEVLEEEQLITSDFDETKLLNLLNNYSIRTNYVNLLYLGFLERVKNKQVIRNNKEIDISYIYSRNQKIKAELLKELRKE